MGQHRGHLYRGRRRHLGSEGHSGGVAIEAVAYLAVVLEVFPTFFDGVGAGGDGVLLLLIADGDRAFDALHDRRFNVSRLADLAGGQQQNAK